MGLRSPDQHKVDRPARFQRKSILTPISCAFCGGVKMSQWGTVPEPDSPNPSDSCVTSELMTLACKAFACELAQLTLKSPAPK